MNQTLKDKKMKTEIFTTKHYRNNLEKGINLIFLILLLPLLFPISYIVTKNQFKKISFKWAFKEYWNIALIRFNL